MATVDQLKAQVKADYAIHAQKVVVEQLEEAIAIIEDALNKGKSDIKRLSLENPVGGSQTLLTNLSWAFANASNRIATAMSYEIDVAKIVGIPDGK